MRTILSRLGRWLRRLIWLWFKKKADFKVALAYEFEPLEPVTRMDHAVLLVKATPGTCSEVYAYCGKRELFNGEKGLMRQLEKAEEKGLVRTDAIGRWHRS